VRPETCLDPGTLDREAQPETSSGKLFQESGEKGNAFASCRPSAPVRVTAACEQQPREQRRTESRVPARGGPEEEGSHAAPFD